MENKSLVVQYVTEQFWLFAAVNQKNGCQKFNLIGISYFA